MADMLGIDRRENKDNQEYRNLKMGIIPKRNCYCDIIEGKWQHKEKGVSTNEYSKMYDRSKYKFFLEANFEISHKCCDVTKKKPLKKYQKETGRHPITAQMASESMLRTQKWIKSGCNAYDCKSPISNPMSFWTEQDVLYYIKLNNLQIASVYGDVVRDYDGTDIVDGQMDMSELDPTLGIFDIGRPLLKTTGCDRTGCMYCGFGCHIGNDQRFVRMKETHPKQYEWIMKPTCDGGLGYKDIIDWINEHGNMHIQY